MNKIIFLALVLLVFFQMPSFAQHSPDSDEISTTGNSADEAAVRAAIEDYVEALYQADSTRIERSVSPDLRKLGYWYDEKRKVYYDDLEMNHQQLVSLAADWNSSGERADENTIKEIILYEVNDKTAIAKLTAAWGIDYFQLAKVGGKWTIRNIIWQSHPR